MVNLKTYNTMDAHLSKMCCGLGAVLVTAVFRVYHASLNMTRVLNFLE